MKKVLIVVDVQRDFCEGGALAATDTASLIGPLVACVAAARQKGAAIAFTQDWHPPDHRSFASRGGRWPAHCVAGSPGAELTPPLSAQPHDLMVRKGIGRDDAGYSPFDGTDFVSRLAAQDISEAAVCGIATEFCIRATALDAARAGLHTVVLTDLIRPVVAAAGEAVLDELMREGIRLSAAAEWLATPATYSRH